MTSKEDNRKRRVAPGDIVTIDLTMIPENGFVPEPLFDSNGPIQFVVGWGNYLPGLHELVSECVAGEKVENVSVDAGWGQRNPDLIVSIPRQKINDLGVEIKVGSLLKFAGGIDVVVQEIGEEHVLLDANAPLAGSSYLCTFTVISIDDNSYTTDIIDSCSASDRYQVATFALGCFWGSELAFMRQHGVCGTRAGYAQGTTANPTYQEVCEGKTRHREAVRVVYDSSVVSYEELVRLALDRLAKTTSSFDLSRIFNEDEENDVQYRHGFYFHNTKQYEGARELLRQNKNLYGVELLEATSFYDAEEEHQQFLYKGGQSARKEARESILCYGK